MGNIKHGIGHPDPVSNRKPFEYRFRALMAFYPARSGFQFLVECVLRMLLNSGTQ